MKTKLTLFVTVLAVALFGVGCASVKITEEQLQNGLVAFYPFNGNAMDGSGNGNHGEVNGATLGKDRHGAEDKAYKFDGTDDDIRVNKLSGAFKDQITISVWVKAASKRQHEFTIIRKESHEYDWGLQIMQSNGVNFGMVTEDMQVGFTSPTRANSIVNNWAHVIAVRDTSNMYVYLNGEKLGNI
jgi:hypothetical protein